MYSQGNVMKRPIYSLRRRAHMCDGSYSAMSRSLRLVIIVILTILTVLSSCPIV